MAITIHEHTVLIQYSHMQFHPINFNETIIIAKNVTALDTVIHRCKYGSIIPP